MSLQIIRQDITKTKCDAIVNATNTKLSPGGHGVDATVHKAAGPELLKECKEKGRINIGEAVYTEAYNLQCRYVIHTAGPKWLGGSEHEIQKLKECYTNSLELARSLNCESVAVPLISSGVMGVPKDKVLNVAIDAIKQFLNLNEMDVILTVFDKSSFELSKTLTGEVREFIDDNYVGAQTLNREYKTNNAASKAKPVFREYNLKQKFGAPMSVAACAGIAMEKASPLEDAIIKLDESFSKRLFKLIDASGMTDVECYKKANVSRQTWHKIISDDKYRPSKNTVISLAIALKLSYEQTNALLASVGFTLSDSILFDIIIKYFLVNEKYDIFEIDSTLLKYDQVTLGSST